MIVNKGKKLAKRFANLHQKYIAPYSIVSTKPIIINIPFFSASSDLTKEAYEILFEYLKEKRVYLICHWSCYIEKEEDILELQKWQQEFLSSYKRFKCIHLCNTENQLAMFENVGLKGIFCNHNCFVDENIFYPQLNIEKQYDAVYDARLTFWKRHHLAEKIKNLAFIYYFSTVDDAKFTKNVIKKFPNAKFFNHTEAGEYRLLSAEKVSECLNSCRVGLCLSEEEGAMYASMQYLLCGLPVVTTPSRGGREVFFNDEFVKTVEPDADAVKEGFEEVIRRSLSPNYIREKTLEKIHPHRKRFIEMVQAIYDQEGFDRKFEDEWDEFFFHRLLKNQNHLETIQQLKHKSV